MNNYYNSGKYFRTAFTNFFNKDIIKLLEDNGCKTKIEEDNRVFPLSDKSQSVQKTLIKLLNESETNYELNSLLKILKKKKNILSSPTISKELKANMLYFLLVELLILKLVLMVTVLDLLRN